MVNGKLVVVRNIRFFHLLSVRFECWRSETMKHPSTRAFPTSFPAKSKIACFLSKGFTLKLVMHTLHFLSMSVWYRGFVDWLIKIERYQFWR
eukprot:UN15143